MDAPLTRTLILEIALPDFYAEDYDLDGEMGDTLRDWCDSDEPTPAELADAALEDSGLTTPRVNLSLLIGGQNGNGIEHVKGEIVGARIVPREPDHELSDDERLDEHEADWIEREARRMRSEADRA